MGSASASSRRSIRILDDRVANQIAAGEVIERPAAVVKELLENSLDAGATRVEIEFKNGGKSYIRVEDNGCGMSPDETLMALERHATSKLRDSTDLQHITSLGFRGEALPSIASVSHFCLQSRAEDWGHGSEVRVHNGKIQHQRECGMAPGTRIEVRNLFSGVPARRKFLKTDQTEAAHIVQLVRLHAAARPETAFILIENGRKVFQSPVCPTLKARVAEIWGRRMADDLEVLDSIDGPFGMQLSGLIGRPGIGRSTRREMITIVNGRPVESRTLAYALIEGYHTALPKHKYPAAFLFLNIDPAAVDVNVHPAKREIRFRDESQVRSFVLRSLLQRLRTISHPKAILSATDAGGGTAADSVRQLPGDRPGTTVSPAPEVKPQAGRAGAVSGPSGGASQASVSPVDTPPAQAASTAKLEWRYLGSFGEHFSLFDSGSGLLLLHRRAARQRIEYEAILKAFQQGENHSQRLLFPVPVDLEAVAAGTLHAHMDFFRRRGFGIEEFGRNFFRIVSHPLWLPDVETEGFVRDLLARIAEGEIDPTASEPAHEAIARMAVQRIRNQNETGGESAARHLAEALMCCEHPLTCPNGRPTLRELSHRDIGKMFGLE